MAAISTKPRRVIDLGSGQCYRSINAAARSIGVQPSSMMRSIDQHRTIGGRYYAYMPEELEGADSAAITRWRMGELLGVIDFCISEE